MPTTGILVVDKPLGWTSFQVVARVRRLSGEKRVGHAGTLDPLATGVLPLALGRATRLIEYLGDATKAYRAEVTLGAVSATYDGEGPITPSTAAPLPDGAALDAALAGFRGAQQQLPPMHSAVQQGGRRLYDLARQGIEVERTPRAIVIHGLDLVDYVPPVATLDVECSKGTYIRSLAHDLGQTLGCGAYLSALTRTRHGPFRLTDAHTMEAVEAAAAADGLAGLLLPPDTILAAWPRIDVDAETAARVLQGRAVVASGPAPGAAAQARVYGPAGAFLAVATWNAAEAAWRPVKVLAGG